MAFSDGWLSTLWFGFKYGMRADTSVSTSHTESTLEGLAASASVTGKGQLDPLALPFPWDG